MIRPLRLLLEAVHRWTAIPPDTPRNPPGSFYPESWVHLVFSEPDERGRYRYTLESFDTEEGAQAWFHHRPELRPYFKGAFREIPGFLARMPIPLENPPQRLERLK